MIPMTYTLSPALAFAILLPAYAAGTFGGSIAAILLNMPGTGAAGVYPRFTYEQSELVGGLQFVSLMIGLFGIFEVLYVVDRGLTRRSPIRQETTGVIQHLAEAFLNYGVLIRSSVIGLIIGVMPGSGPTIGSVVSYGIEKRFGGNRTRMGDGAP